MEKPVLYWVECPCETCARTISGRWINLHARKKEVEAELEKLRASCREKGGQFFKGMAFCTLKCKRTALEPVALDD